MDSAWPGIGLSLLLLLTVFKELAPWPVVTCSTTCSTHAPREVIVWPGTEHLSSGTFNALTAFYQRQSLILPSTNCTGQIVLLSIAEISPRRCVGSVTGTGRHARRNILAGPTPSGHTRTKRMTSRTGDPPFNMNYAHTPRYNPWPRCSVSSAM